MNAGDEGLRAVAAAVVNGVRGGTPNEKQLLHALEAVLAGTSERQVRGPSLTQELRRVAERREVAARSREHFDALPIATRRRIERDMRDAQEEATRIVRTHL